MRGPRQRAIVIKAARGSDTRRPGPFPSSSDTGSPRSFVASRRHRRRTNTSSCRARRRSTTRQAVDVVEVVLVYRFRRDAVLIPLCQDLAAGVIRESLLEQRATRLRRRYRIEPRRNPGEVRRDTHTEAQSHEVTKVTASIHLLPFVPSRLCVICPPYQQSGRKCDHHNQTSPRMHEYDSRERLHYQAALSCQQ